ncbi:hypothetical protein GWK47_002266 [Chionoecetes opilio]|uniref:Uncharacterized protein n=1 Tax=Chionoecetes opilio TaxID=41210 RepID=A0A8J4XYA7_CHIOP|nr:hypothetical protein GWK47_002266 [Chionoecetes opilio]
MSSSQTPRRCCVCTRREHKCLNCKCGRLNRRCVNCNNGNECQNPSRREQGREREEEAGDNLELQEEDQQDGRQRDNEMPESPIALTPVSSPRTPPPPHDVPQPNIDVEENEGGNIFWKGQTEEETKRWVDNTYLEIMGWSANNNFEPPKCTAMTKLIKVMVCLINEYNLDTPFAPYALKVLFLLPKLFLQKTHQKAKTNNNVKALTRRVELWEKNKLEELLEEASLTEKTAKTSPPKKKQR